MLINTHIFPKLNLKMSYIFSWWYVYKSQAQIYGMKNKHFKLCLQMEMSHSKCYINPCPFFPHKSQFCLKKQITFSLCLWVYFFVVLSLCHVRLFATPWIEACQTSLVLHCLPEFAQTHVHWIDDAIQPSDPLSSLFPPALNLSQHQGLFQWISSSHGCI